VFWSVDVTLSSHSTTARWEGVRRAYLGVMGMIREMCDEYSRALCHLLRKCMPRKDIRLYAPRIS
jgi:hypothetical protein